MILWILFYSGFLIVKVFTKMINDGDSKTKNNESGKPKKINIMLMMLKKV